MKIKMEKRKTPQKGRDPLPVAHARTRGNPYVSKHPKKRRETPTSGHFRSGPLPVAPPPQIPLENLLYTKNDLENMEEKQVE